MDRQSKQVKHLPIPRYLLLRILRFHHSLHYSAHLHKEVDLQCRNCNLSYLLFRSNNNGWLLDCQTHTRILEYE
jgi:hypothetical protein